MCNHYKRANYGISNYIAIVYEQDHPRQHLDLRGNGAKTRLDMPLTLGGRCRNSGSVAPIRFTGAARRPKWRRSSLEAAVVIGNQINTAGAAMSAEYFAHELEVARMPEIHHGTVQQLARGVY